MKAVPMTMKVYVRERKIYIISFTRQKVIIKAFKLNYIYCTVKWTIIEFSVLMSKKRVDRYHI